MCVRDDDEGDSVCIHDELIKVSIASSLPEWEKHFDKRGGEKRDKKLSYLDSLQPNYCGVCTQTI